MGEVPFDEGRFAKDVRPYAGTGTGTGAGTGTVVEVGASGAQWGVPFIQSVPCLLSTFAQRGRGSRAMPFCRLWSDARGSWSSWLCVSSASRHTCPAGPFLTL